VRSGEEVEAVMLMSIAEDLKDLILLILLLLLVSFTLFIVLPIVIQILHPPEEVLNKFLILSQIAAAIGTIIMALVTTESVKTMREVLKVEKLRDSFKTIARGLRRARKVVDDNFGKIEAFLKATEKVVKKESLEAPRAERLAEISLGDVSVDVTRKDFRLHYGKRGLKLLDDIEACNKKIREYNRKLSELRDSLERPVVEVLRSRNIGVEPDRLRLTHVCATAIDGELRVLLYVSPEECRKRFSHWRILSVYDHVDAILRGLDRVLEVCESEEKLSRELAGLYREIRSSDEFQRFLKDLKRVAEEAESCLDRLKGELEKVINDILKKYTISEQEVAVEEGAAQTSAYGSPGSAIVRLISATEPPCTDD